MQKGVALRSGLPEAKEGRAQATAEPRKNPTRTTPLTYDPRKHRICRNDEKEYHDGAKLDAEGRWTIKGDGCNSRAAQANDTTHAAHLRTQKTQGTL